MKKLYSLDFKTSRRFLYTLFFAAVCLSGFGQGTAPVNPPAGGFRIEGDLRANDPVAGIGDWIPGNAGSGGFVLNSGGTPLNLSTTYHIIDPYGGGDDV